MAHPIIAFKILSNLHRLAIVRLLSEAKKDLCVQEIAAAIDASQSATSHQLACLEAYGVVSSFLMGKEKCYVLTDHTLAKTLVRIIRVMG